LEPRRFQLRVLHVCSSAKRATYFGPTYHISTPHPTFSISSSFVGCFHISVFFSPL